MAAHNKEYHDKEWEQKFNETKVWLRSHPHGETPPRHGSTLALSYWWTTQRRQNVDGSLLASRKKRLNEIGFPFDPQPRIADRHVAEKRVQQLERFYHEHGHYRVPYRSGSQYKGLGKYMQKLRRGEIGDGGTEMIEGQIPGLAKKRNDDPRVHPEAREKRWWEWYEKLKRFYRRFGHSSVPRGWHEDPSLGIWVYKQRVKYRSDTLESKKVSALNKLGFVWNPATGPDVLRGVK